MDRKTIIDALGLKDDATDAQISERLAALAALEKQPPLPKAMTAALGLAEGADEAAALAAVGRLKTPDAGMLAQVTELQGQVAALSTQIIERDVTEAVVAAIEAYKLMPAQREWAMSLGRKDMAALTAFITNAPAIPGLAGQSGGNPRDPKAGAVDPIDVARRAQAYQTAQLAAGVELSTAQAVDAVLSGAAK